jgi:hypothetical protein
MQKRFSIGFSLLGSALIAGACAPPPAPTMRTGPEAEVTYDGLHRVDNAGFAMVWVKPEAGLARYSKIMTTKPSFHYRVLKETARRMDDEFEVPERRREQFEKIVEESFEKSLAKSKYYQLTTEPGPDTLTLLSALHDIVSKVPPERGDRSTTFVSEIGEATLVLELRDSESNEVLARAAERRSVVPTQELSMSSGVNSASEVRKAAGKWAGKLRDQLDALHER